MRYDAAGGWLRPGAAGRGAAAAAGVGTSSGCRPGPTTRCCPAAACLPLRRRWLRRPRRVPRRGARRHPPSGTGEGNRWWSAAAPVLEWGAAGTMPGQREDKGRRRGAARGRLLLHRTLGGSRRPKGHQGVVGQLRARRGGDARAGEERVRGRASELGGAAARPTRRVRRRGPGQRGAAAQDTPATPLVAHDPAALQHRAGWRRDPVHAKETKLVITMHVSVKGEQWVCDWLWWRERDLTGTSG